MDIMRLRTAGDYTFVARACGIPAREAASMDTTLLAEVASYLGSSDGIAGNTVAAEKIFLRSTDGGLGFQSVSRTSPAAYAASWHACLPKIFERLGLQGASALTAISPWAAHCLPSATATLREAMSDDSVDIGDDGLAASQHTLAKAPDAVAAKRVSEQVAADVKAAAALRRRARSRSMDTSTLHA